MESAVGMDIQEDERLRKGLRESLLHEDFGADERKTVKKAMANIDTLLEVPGPRSQIVKSLPHSPCVCATLAAL